MFANISLVKYCYMCYVQHHDTDLFWQFLSDIPRIKKDNACHLLHYDIRPFLCKCLQIFPLMKSCYMYDLQHHGTDLFGPFIRDFP